MVGQIILRNLSKELRFIEVPVGDQRLREIVDRVDIAINDLRRPQPEPMQIGVDLRRKLGMISKKLRCISMIAEPGERRRLTRTSISLPAS